MGKSVGGPRCTGWILVSQFAPPPLHPILSLTGRQDGLWKEYMPAPWGPGGETARREMMDGADIASFLPGTTEVVYQPGLSLRAAQEEGVKF